MYMRVMMGKLKSSLLLVSMLVCISAVATGCASYKDIRITSYNIESIFPKGLRTVQATFKVGLDNPAPEVTISDVRGVLYRQDKELGELTTSPFTIQGRTSSQVSLTGVLSLSPSVTFQEIMAIAMTFRPEEYYIDVSMKVKVKGAPAKKLKIRRLPARVLFNMVKK